MINKILNISKKGYKKNSPHVNRPFNVIPSNKITMKEDDGTPLKKGPILGIGIGKILEYKKMMPGKNYKFSDNVKYVIEKPLDNHQLGGQYSPKKRMGVRQNPDGTVSSHLMRTEVLPNGNWVSFPSLFQNEDKSWVDMSNEEDWMKIYKEAERRGEVYNFGKNKEAALAFGMGSWKKDYQKGGERTYETSDPEEYERLKKEYDAQLRAYNKYKDFYEVDDPYNPTAFRGVGEDKTPYLATEDYLLDQHGVKEGYFPLGKKVIGPDGVPYILGQYLKGKPGESLESHTSSNPAYPVTHTLFDHDLNEGIGTINWNIDDPTTSSTHKYYWDPAFVGSVTRGNARYAYEGVKISPEEQGHPKPLGYAYGISPGGAPDIPIYAKPVKPVYKQATLPVKRTERLESDLPNKLVTKSEPRLNLHREYNPYTGQFEPMSPRQKRMLDRAKYLGKEAPEFTPEPYDAITMKPLKGAELFRYKMKTDPNFRDTFNFMLSNKDTFKFQKGGSIPKYQKGDSFNYLNNQNTKSKKIPTTDLEKYLDLKEKLLNTEVPSINLGLPENNYKPSNIYKYAFAEPSPEGFFGLATLGSNELGLEGTIGGYLPYDIKTNPYFKGDYFINLQKNLGKFSIGAGANKQIFGYPDQSGNFTRVPSGISPNFNLRFNFQGGGSKKEHWNFITNPESEAIRVHNLPRFNYTGFDDPENPFISYRIQKPYLFKKPIITKYDDDSEEYTFLEKGTDEYKDVFDRSREGLKNDRLTTRTKNILNRGYGNKEYIPSQEVLDRVAYQKANWGKDKMGDTDILENMIIKDITGNESIRNPKEARKITRYNKSAFDIAKSLLYPDMKQGGSIPKYQTGDEVYQNLPEEIIYATPESRKKYQDIYAKAQSLLKTFPRAAKLFSENKRYKNKGIEGLSEYVKDVTDYQKNAEDYYRARQSVKSGRLSTDAFNRAYQERGWQQYDNKNVITSPEDQEKLENIWYGTPDATGRRTWMDDPRNVVDVAKTAAIGSIGAAAAPILSPTIGAILRNPLVQAGLTTYGAHHAVTKDIPEAYKDFSEGRYWEGLGNTGWAALNLAPIPAFGSNIVKSLPSAKQIRRAANYIPGLESPAFVRAQNIAFERGKKFGSDYLFDPKALTKVQKIDAEVSAITKEKQALQQQMRNMSDDPVKKNELYNQIKELASKEKALKKDYVNPIRPEVWEKMSALDKQRIASTGTLREAYPGETVLNYKNLLVNPSKPNVNYYGDKISLGDLQGFKNSWLRGSIGLNRAGTGNWAATSRTTPPLSKYKYNPFRYTYRNMSPKEIAETAAHETRHTLQQLKNDWRKSLSSQPKSPLGKEFENALVDKSWYKEVGELDAQTFASKFNVYNKLLKSGVPKEQALNMVTNPSDELWKKILKEPLNQRSVSGHFKPNVSTNQKINLLKYLPATLVGVGSATIPFLGQESNTNSNVYKQGGSINDYKIGDEVDKDTYLRLKKLGYKFE